jgi:hypothetical protein
VQTKGIENISNTLIAENASNLETEFVIHVQEAFSISNRQEQNRIIPYHFIVKTKNTEQR